MRTYQSHLRNLLQRETPGVLRNRDLRYVLSHRTAASAKGKALKRLEDKLDAVTCALAAWMLWRDPSRWEMLGDLDGYIVVPRDAP